MQIKPGSIAAVLALAVTLASSASWANVIVNGDFEAPVISGPFAASGFEYRATLPGWTVVSPDPPHRGVVLFNATYGQPVGGGAQSLQIEYPGDYIEQAIPTLAGETYLLTFDLSAYTPPGVSVLDVEIDGVAAPFSPFGGVSATYTTYGLLFTATGASTLLHFESAGALFTYPHLDNITAAVPEPATLALFGASLLGLGILRRRRRA